MSFHKNKIMPMVGALGFAMVLGTAGTASAQGTDVNGPDGMRYRHGPKMHRVRSAERYHTLTVRRHREEQPIAVLPPPPPPAGPEVIVTAPVRAAREAVALPFRVLNSVFPAEGNIGTNPLVLIGAPIRAAGEIAQVPFRIVEAPFAPAEPYRFSGPTVF